MFQSFQVLQLLSFDIENCFPNFHFVSTVVIISAFNIFLQELFPFGKLLTFNFYFYKITELYTTLTSLSIFLFDCVAHALLAPFSTSASGLFSVSQKIDKGNFKEFSTIINFEFSLNFFFLELTKVFQEHVFKVSHISVNPFIVLYL